MPLVDRLERKYGWIAIPGIVRILAAFQLMVYILGKFNDGIYEWLILFPPAVLGGEVWRILSFAFVIPPSMGVFFAVLSTFFLIFLGELLEREWGSFRLTLYVVGGIAALIVATFFTFYFIGSHEYAEFLFRTKTTGLIWVTTILCGAAVLQPNYQVNLLGVLPVKLFWIALFDGGLVVLDLIALAGKHPLLPLALLFAISNFLIAFGPSTVRLIRQRGEVTARRRKFDSAKMPENESLHRCATCGKTEHDDPELEFRVAADGEEYCTEHLPVSKP